MPAQSAGWRDLKINGESAAGFETSVATLLNELPSQRRANFEVALAAVWMSHAVDTSDPDQDGYFGPNDLRLLKNYSVALLAAIDRGDLFAAVEKSEKTESKYSVARYLKDLDGLGCDEVVALAGELNTGPVRAAVKQFRIREMCGRPDWVEMQSWCQTYFRTTTAPTLGKRTLEVLNEAIQAFNVQKYDEARSAIGQLQLDRLSPYERAKTEQILFQIAANQRNLGEAREHLVNAIDSGGLNDDEIVRSLNTIRAIDEQVAAGTNQ
jgi:hypothetical protein